MKIFLDANIIVSVLNREYPTYTYTSRILSLADHPHFQLFTSPICLAIAFYFAEKKSGSKVAKQKLSVLVSKICIAGIDQSSVQQAIADKRVHDLEDGMEYFAALSAGCQYLVTEDTKDFYYSKIPVLNSHDFFASILSSN